VIPRRIKALSRRLTHAVVWAVVCTGAGACTPTACNNEERVVSREVEVLIGEPGPGIKAAKERLRARGRDAIAILETGLYQADALGRLRIIEVLEDIGDREAVPILRHLARRDDDQSVRERATRALEHMGVADTE
jgi:hypothetical protein